MENVGVSSDNESDREAISESCTLSLASQRFDSAKDPDFEPLALQFITVADESGRFELNEDVISTLQNHTSNKIAVVAICGEINSGKSFLMNQFLRVKNAFQLNRQQSETQKTQGVWIYTEPITIEKEGDILDIFLMDCEGFKPSSDIYQIRLLALILSLASVIIFNTKGIAGTQLNALNMVQQLRYSDLGFYCNPQLLWLLRDVESSTLQSIVD